jgi:hypothetical protein
VIIDAVMVVPPLLVVVGPLTVDTTGLASVICAEVTVAPVVLELGVPPPVVCVVLLSELLVQLLPVIGEVVKVEPLVLYRIVRVPPVYWVGCATPSIETLCTVTPVIVSWRITLRPPLQLQLAVLPVTKVTLLPPVQTLLSCTVAPTRSLVSVLWLQAAPGI